MLLEIDFAGRPEASVHERFDDAEALRREMFASLHRVLLPGRENSPLEAVELEFGWGGSLIDEVGPGRPFEWSSGRVVKLRVSQD
jgi:hypothetical protein